MQHAFLASALQESNWLAPCPGRLTSGKTTPFTGSAAHPTSHSIHNTGELLSLSGYFGEEKRSLAFARNRTMIPRSSIPSSLYRLTYLGLDKQGVRERVSFSRTTTQTRSQLSTLFFHGATAPYRARASSLSRVRDHTQTHHTR
jgi:hypothetical protein